MDTDDFTPDLSKLEQDYQILTELHRSRDSRTYLARHLELNRDVTITVVRREASGTQSLSRFAGDVERLKTARHPNVIPVIDGRWLADGCFAVVRARVRGSTLDQLLGAVGALPLVRVESALEQVQPALEWAKINAIANRAVDPSSIVFQQGSGRVLLSLEPSPLAPTPGNCEDAHVVGRLAWEMLAGQTFDPASTGSLAELRPDLSPAVVAETEALMRCGPGGAPDVAAYLAMLGEAATTTATASVAARPTDAQLVTAAAVPADVAAPPAAAPPPVGRTGDAVVVRRQGWGFGARFATGVAVLAVIAVLAFFFLNRRGQPLVDNTAASGQGESTGQAAGDLAMTSQEPAPITTSPSTPYPSSGIYPRIVPQPDADSVQPPASMIAPPEMRRHEPLNTTPPFTFPDPTTSPADSAGLTPPSPATTDVGDVCSSPSSNDQHTCLMNAIERNDVELNAVYQQLTAALRRQANVGPGDPDPASLQRLRSEEHEWVAERDRACRDAGSGPLYAPQKAQCFAAESNQRTSELRQMLNAIPNG